MQNTRFHLLISGRVQGVLFRQGARAKALELGLTGFAKNLLDGKVEIIVEGPKEKVKEIIDEINKNLIFFSKINLIFNDFSFLSEINDVLIIFFMVPSARLELALPKGQGF